MHEAVTKGDFGRQDCPLSRRGKRAQTLATCVACLPSCRYCTWPEEPCVRTAVRALSRSPPSPRLVPLHDSSTAVVVPIPPTHSHFPLQCHIPPSPYDPGSAVHETSPFAPNSPPPSFFFFNNAGVCTIQFWDPWTG